MEDEINIKETTIHFDEPKLISTDSYGVEISVMAEISYLVELDIPDESSGWYDDEDKVWHYFEQTTLEVKHTASIPVSITIDIAVDEGQVSAYGLNAYEINAGKELVVRDERRPYNKW